MKFITDFHIHSKYSRATSQSLTPENLDLWAAIKGIQVMGTGDAVHPGWSAELRDKLEGAGNGLYRLRPDARILKPGLPIPARSRDTFFLLTTEISTIYKKDGAVRKVHHLCVLPDFDALEKFQTRLGRIGNIASDGRPILGLDSQHLLEILLECSPDAYLIPAHIWTPWFSVLGSKSGFDRIEDCYGDLTEHVFALETGLSSDPTMNRMCSFLDSFRLVSNSDAHSLEKLGREANIFDTALSYHGILNALKYDRGFLGTIEFFPNEGKYHYDGHRDCKVCWDPAQTLKHQGICPVCSRPVTVGVMNRVAQLADRKMGAHTPHQQTFTSITPLADLIAEILGTSTTSRKVQTEYFRLIERIGSEFYILLDATADELTSRASDIFAEGIRRLRAGHVHLKHGYDGEFGRITVFTAGELKRIGKHAIAFEAAKPAAPLAQTGSLFDIDGFQTQLREQAEQKPIPAPTPEQVFNDGQQRAIQHTGGPCLVVAGPGSGKTYVLTQRIAHLVTAGNIPADRILAMTFSNKAAEEIQHRLIQLLPNQALTIQTFHAFGLAILKTHAPLLGRTSEFSLMDPEVRQSLDDTLNADQLQAYKQQHNCFDLDDLITQPLFIFNNHPEVLHHYREKFTHIFVDEFQDLNDDQYAMLCLLSASGRTPIFAIGDPDQAIYGFRGANANLTDAFRNDFPLHTEITLPYSYRCPAPVLNTASLVLDHPQRINSLHREGEPVHLRQYQADTSEARDIAATIEKLMGGVSSYSLNSGNSDGQAELTSFAEVAILCRSHFMFAPIERALGKRGIPVQVIGQTPFYRQEPLKTFLTEFSQTLQDQYLSERLPTLLDIRLRELTLPEIQKKMIIDMSRPFADQPVEFFRSLQLRSGIDLYDPRAEAVTLMTLHAAKGLEFDTIFIPGLENKLLPFELFGALTSDALAEEARLLYVGMTRSKHRLFLSHAGLRQYKSRTLRENKSCLLDRLDAARLIIEKEEPVQYQMNLF